MKITHKKPSKTYFQWMYLGVLSLATSCTAINSWAELAIKAEQIVFTIQGISRNDLQTKSNAQKIAGGNIKVYKGSTPGSTFLVLETDQRRLLKLGESQAGTISMMTEDGKMIADDSKLNNILEFEFPTDLDATIDATFALKYPDIDMSGNCTKEGEFYFITLK